MITMTAKKHLGVHYIWTPYGNILKPYWEKSPSKAIKNLKLLHKEYLYCETYLFPLTYTQLWVLAKECGEDLHLQERVLKEYYKTPHGERRMINLRYIPPQGSISYPQVEALHREGL